MFNSLVRSSLEYCSVVWTPYYDVHKRRLESIQKRFLWHLSFQCGKAKQLPSYNSRLCHFKLLSLDNRRQMLDHLFLHKVVNSYLDCSDLLKHVNYNVPYRLARLSRYLPFKAKSSKTNLGHFSAINRMQSQFNRLSRSSVTDSVSIDMSYSTRKFKSMLVDVFMSKP